MRAQNPQHWNPPTEHLILGPDSKKLWHNVAPTTTYVFDLEIQTLVLTADVSSAIAGTVFQIHDIFK